MEHSKQIIDQLLAELGRLNNKVDNFRQQILTQFNEFTENVLTGVPEKVSCEVTRVIAESMANYPHLSKSGGYKADDSGRVESESPATKPPPRQGRKSPPPVLHHTSGKPKNTKEKPRGPHDRDFEFQGLFTPSYLPLLDGNEPPPRTKPSTHDADRVAPFRRTTSLFEGYFADGSTNSPGGEPVPDDSPPASPPSPHEVAQPKSQPPPPTREEEPEDAPEVEFVEEVEAPDTSKDKEVTRPSLAREPTDASVVSSVGSSTGEHKPRRSALRRSSSSTKGSPRRVRFDVEGTEVLPTASPQPTESHMMDLAKEAEASSAIDDSEDYTGPSLSDVEGEEDAHPRPPRVSSTEALRRLSRTPSDDGTIWTPSDAVPSNNGLGPGDQTGSLAEKSTTRLNIATPPMLATPEDRKETRRDKAPMNGSTPVSNLLPTGPVARKPVPAAAGQTAARSLPEQKPRDTPEEEEPSSSEEEFLKMKISPRKSPSPAAASPATLSPAGKSPLAYTLSLRPKEDSPKLSAPVKDKGKGKHVAGLDKGKGKGTSREQVGAGPAVGDDDEPFNFGPYEDDLDSDLELGSTKKYLPDEPDEEEPEADKRKGNKAPPLTGSLYSTSPAMAIPQRNSGSSPSSSTASTRPAVESIGSYKGQPLRMGVVKDWGVAAAASSMGDLKTYVGSVHGRTGIDPVDESSYRASFSNARHARLPSGEPRSFSERLMMEEAMGGTKDED